MYDGCQTKRAAPFSARGTTIGTSHGKDPKGSSGHRKGKPSVVRRGPGEVKLPPRPEDAKRGSSARGGGGGELQPRRLLPHTAPRPRPRRPAVRGDEHPAHRGGSPRGDRPAPPGGAAFSRRAHRRGSRAGADPPRILPADSRAHEHAGRLRLPGGRGGVRPDGGVPRDSGAPPSEGGDRPDRRALSRGRGDLRPRVDVLLLLRQMFFLLVSRRKEREPRGVRPAVPAPVRPRGGAGGDLLHPGPVPSAAPARPRPPGGRPAEDRGADAGGGLRGRRRIGVPRGPRRHPRGYSRGGGGGRKADPLAGDRPGNDARTARGRGPGRGGDGGRIGGRRGPSRGGGAG